MGKLGSDSEELGDEPYFRNNVTLCYPSDSALADHVHGFYSFESSPRTLKGAVAFCQPGPLFAPADPDAAPGSDLRFLWDEQNHFAEGPDRLTANLRRIGISRILFGTDWPVVIASDYISTLRTHLGLTPAETNRIFSNLAPYFP